MTSLNNSSVNILQDLLEQMKKMTESQQKMTESQQKTTENQQKMTESQQKTTESQQKTTEQLQKLTEEVQKLKEEQQMMKEEARSWTTYVETKLDIVGQNVLELKNKVQVLEERSAWSRIDKVASNTSSNEDSKGSSKGQSNQNPMVNNEIGTGQHSYGRGGLVAEKQQDRIRSIHSDTDSIFKEEKDSVKVIHDMLNKKNEFEEED